HAFMRQPETFCCDGSGYSSERESIATQLQNSPYSTLLGGILDQRPVIAHFPAKRDDSAEIALPLSLISLHVADALANAIPLGFGHRREDRKDELRNTVPSHVPTQIDHVETDAPILEPPKDI